MPDTLLLRARAAFEAGTPVPVVAAYLFGSHAAGRAHRESDVDIGVWLPYAGPMAIAAGRFAAGARLGSWLQAELRTSQVDLVVLNDAPPGLAAAVATTGVLLHCTDSEGEHALRRDAMLRAADLAPFLRRARRLKLEALAR